MQRGHRPACQLVLGLLLTSFQLATFVELARGDNFYQGKQVQIVVGFAPGGGFDAYARLIARHMGRHIPGNPSLVVTNMPGAGSIIAANYLFRRARPDGLTIGNFLGSLSMNQLLGTSGIEFDTRRFHWLGIPVRQDGACAFASASGVTDIPTWKASRHPVKIGATGAGTLDYVMPKLLKTMLGLPVQVIAGYKGTSDIRLAVEGGELAGGCWQWQSMRATWKSALESGRVNPVLQFTSKPLADLSKVSLASALATNEQEKLLLKVAVQNPNLLTMAYALAPSTPVERGAVLRLAFSQTLRDPTFLEDAKRSNLEIDPIPGEEAEKLIDTLFQVDAGLWKKMQSVILE